MCWDCGCNLTADTCLCCDCADCIRPSIGIDDWFRILAVNPYYGFQMAQDINDYPGTPIPLDAVQPCNWLVYNSGLYGGSQAGRNEIWDALLLAEQKFHRFTGYWSSPTFDCDEWSYKKAYIGGPIRLKNAKLKSIGREAFTLLQSVTISAATAIADANNDGILDTITFTIPVQAGVSVSEIAVYFSQEDWNGDDRCRHEIRPISVRTVGANWEISFSSWMAVRPKLYVGFPQSALNPENLSIYALKFDVYRRWSDPTAAIVAWRKNIPCSCCSNTGECYTCYNVDACIVNAERSIIEIRPKVSNENFCCPVCTQRLCIHYLSGDCDNDNLIARLASAELGRDICCGGNTEIKYWMQDFVGVTSSGKLTTVLNARELSNPFGTRRGQIEAYRYLLNRRATKAIRI